MPPWDDGPTLWLRLDLSSAVDVYAKFEEMVFVLRDAISTPDHTDLAHYVLEQNWEYIAIVPVVRGRMLGRLAWKLHTQTTIVSQADFQDCFWSYTPQPIPDSLFGALGIPFWESESIALADNLRSGIATASLLLEQLADLADIPDATVEGLKVLSDYLDRQGKIFSEHMQNAYDAGAAMFSYYNALSEAEQQRRASLAEAAAGLHDLHSLIAPAEGCGESGAYRFDLDQITEFAKRLSEARTLAEVVWLFWVDDTIEQTTRCDANEHETDGNCLSDQVS